MTFLHQFSLLWLVAWGALGFFILSVGWLFISALWRFLRIRPETIESESNLSKPGEPELYVEPPKRLTASQIAKSMLLAAAILGAYQVGATTKYSKEYAGWQQRNAEYEREHTAYQEAVARWKAKQKENR